MDYRTPRHPSPVPVPYPRPTLALHVKTISSVLCRKAPLGRPRRARDEPWRTRSCFQDFAPRRIFLEMKATVATTAARDLLEIIRLRRNLDEGSIRLACANATKSTAPFEISSTSSILLHYRCAIQSILKP